MQLDIDTPEPFDTYLERQIDKTLAAIKKLNSEIDKAASPEEQKELEKKLDTQLNNLDILDKFHLPAKMLWCSEPLDSSAMSDSSSTSESGSTPKSSTAERNLDDFNKDE